MKPQTDEWKSLLLELDTHEIANRDSHTFTMVVPAGYDTFNAAARGGGFTNAAGYLELNLPIPNIKTVSEFLEHIDVVMTDNLDLICVDGSEIEWNTTYCELYPLRTYTQIDVFLDFITVLVHYDSQNRMWVRDDAFC